MKRVLLILLLCLCSISHSFATIFTKSVQATVGVPFVIDPAKDCGGAYKDLWYMNGLYEATTSGDYEYIPTLFTYTEESYTSSKGSVGRIFTITPLEAGITSFRLSVAFNTGTIYQHRITYTINIVDVTSVSIDDLDLTIGESAKLSPRIQNSLATPILTWNSSNTSIATVSNDGTVTAVGLGTATITCSAHNGVSGQSTITVNPIYIESISISESEHEMMVGEKFQLETTILPSNASIKELEWSSTNEAVVLVDQNGMIRAVGSGSCFVNANAKDGSNKSAGCFVSVAKDNKLTVTDMTQCSGGQGMLNVLLSDEETVMGFQFDLELPTGVTVGEKDGKLLAQLTGNAPNTHSISSSKVSDGLYRFVVTPQGSRAISQATGDGMTITVDVADDVAVGNYDMTIKDIEMTVKHTGNVYEDIHPKNSTATLTVTEAVMGDVNGDGRVSVTDVISMNSYILEEEPAQFIRKVADLNSDGKVTITDMVQVIDIILGR